MLLGLRNLADTLGRNIPPALPVDTLGLNGPPEWPVDTLGLNGLPERHACGVPEAVFQ